jgi:hypothetical protein
LEQTVDAVRLPALLCHFIVCAPAAPYIFYKNTFGPWLIMLEARTRARIDLSPLYFLIDRSQGNNS